MVLFRACVWTALCRGFVEIMWEMILSRGRGGEAGGRGDEGVADAMETWASWTERSWTTTAIFAALCCASKARHVFSVDDDDRTRWVIMLMLMMSMTTSTSSGSVDEMRAVAACAGCLLGTFALTRYDPIRGERTVLGVPRTWQGHIMTLYLVVVAVSLSKAVASWCTIRRVVSALASTFSALALIQPPVSRPAGPRPTRIRREPQWRSKDWTFDASQWSYVGATASHSSTNAASPNRQIRLTGEASGRQTWETTTTKTTKTTVSFNPSHNPNTSDRVFREQRIAAWRARQEDTSASCSADDDDGVDDRDHRPSSSSKGDATSSSLASRSRHAAERSLRFFQMLQCDDGHWAGDYGGPHFLMPGMIIVWYVTGKSPLIISNEQARAMSHYLRVHQQRDGGWGTHIESPSTMFGSVLCYVALRLLGARAEDDACVAARSFIRSNGGALYTSSWAKFGLSLLGVMDWRGTNPIPPELWLLPNWFPFHPGRMWCHARMVYLPMSVLYGQRFVYKRAETDPLIARLRDELYVESYDTIEWSKTRHWIAPMDNYSPVGTFMRTAQDLLVMWERWGGALQRRLRQAGVSFAMAYIRAEDEQTNYVDIGPVNKVYNMLCVWSEDAKGDASYPAFVRHALRVRDYLWVAEDGMKMQGYNGSQCWDTSFASQAIVESGLADTFPDVVRGAWRFLERTQILSTASSQSTAAFVYEQPKRRDRFYRHVSRGGWPFSTSAHGWPISDCTAEGLKAVLSMRDLPCVSSQNTISRKRLADAANVLLTLQNTDGGWATYENNRGYGFFELLNPSEVFGDIMIDYSYVECSMASMTGLVHYLSSFPDDPRRVEIESSIARGKRFIKTVQREDGSWYGSWACCFTYGCWFGLEGLVLAGESKSSESIRKCVQYLLSHQHTNGGWGEDFSSCYDKSFASKGMRRYGDEQGSGVVQTAWALLGLMIADDRADVTVQRAIERGIRYLISRQRPDGDFPQEGILGVFNRTCGITYTNYRNIFPMWALGRYHQAYCGEGTGHQKA